MRAKGTQHPSPLILQLFKNREEQRATDAQKHDLEFFTTQPIEGGRLRLCNGMDSGIFSVFWLSLLSDIFYSSGYLP